MYLFNNSIYCENPVRNIKTFPLSLLGRRIIRGGEIQCRKVFGVHCFGHINRPTTTILPCIHNDSWSQGQTHSEDRGFNRLVPPSSVTMEAPCGQKLRYSIFQLHKYPAVENLAPMGGVSNICLHNHSGLLARS